MSGQSVLRGFALVGALFAWSCDEPAPREAGPEPTDSHDARVDSTHDARVDPADDAGADAASCAVDAAAHGTCEADRDLNCDEHAALCKRTRPSCPYGTVAAVVDGCWGDCVEISRCVCHRADECPEPERYACHMSAQHCGPYVN